ncbi:MAG: hypothetical protein R2770_00785 [Acidimicrobiales bacterium]
MVLHSGHIVWLSVLFLGTLAARLGVIAPRWLVGVLTAWTESIEALNGHRDVEGPDWIQEARTVRDNRDANPIDRLREGWRLLVRAAAGDAVQVAALAASAILILSVPALMLTMIRQSWPNYQNYGLSDWAYEAIGLSLLAVVSLGLISAAASELATSRVIRFASWWRRYPSFVGLASLPGLFLGVVVFEGRASQYPIALWYLPLACLASNVAYQRLGGGRNVAEALAVSLLTFAAALAFIVGGNGVDPTSRWINSSDLGSVPAVSTVVLLCMALSGAWAISKLLTVAGRRLSRIHTRRVMTICKHEVVRDWRREQPGSQSWTVERCLVSRRLQRRPPPWKYRSEPLVQVDEATLNSCIEARCGDSPWRH